MENTNIDGTHYTFMHACIQTFELLLWRLRSQKDKYAH